MDKVRRIIGLLLIVVGVVIIGNVVYKKVITAQKNKQLIEIFENGIIEGNSSGNKDQSVNLDNINGYTPIAIIEIPSIKLVQPLVDGIDDNTLQYFLGHFPTSVMPGEKGNFAVAGHRVSDYTDAFVNLYKVLPGDNVIVKTKEKIYTYEIEENFIVNPDKVEVLSDTDDPTITLVTCTVGAKQRVIVKGKLISTKDING